MISLSNTTFLSSVARYSLLPNDNIPEIAFFGRSNVGKSSLINSLCNSRSLAKSSSTPGKTRTMNMYSLPLEFQNCIDSNFIRIIDLPGYGYSKIPTHEKILLQKQLSQYILFRKNLCICIIVVDSRHPLTELDYIAIENVEQNLIHSIIIFNKIDKLNQTQKHSCLTTMSTLKSHFTNTKPLFLMYSATKKIGTKILINTLSNYIYNLLHNNSSL